MDLQPTVGLCGNCGRPLTQVGRKGECLRCLADLGFLSENGEGERAEKSRRLTPAPLKYDHFAVEVGADGFPIELGAGAMAITYRARDTVLNSVVALKVIDRKVAQVPGARSRFLREARAAAQIRHPNVARVSHYGEQDGECFYVMELVEGETLEASVRRDGPMPLAEALAIIEQVARALAAAEACGVVHRDIKPSNIMLECDPGGTPIVKVIDYGVAKVLLPDATSSEFQTQAGFIGTPAFASPEQFVSSGQSKIDTRSDIYSLGTTLWYLLSGRVPFVGGTLEELRVRQTQPLPVAQLKGLHIPSPCLALLKSMLAADPNERPRSARELLSSVHRCYVRFEPSARRIRRRFALAAGAVALAVALAVAANSIFFHSPPSHDLDHAIAVLPFENLSANADDRFLAIGIQDEVLTKLASLSDLKVISRTSTQKYQSKPSDLRTIGRQLGVGRVIEGSVQKGGGKVRVNIQLIDARTDAHLWAESYDRPVDDAFAVETEIANAIAQQLNASTAEFHAAASYTPSPAAYMAYLRGLGIQHEQSSDTSIKNAAAAYTEAVKLDPNFALAWARLALVRSFLYSNAVDRNANSAITVKEAADRAFALNPKLGEALLAQGQYKSSVLHDRVGAINTYQEARKYLPNSSLVHEYMAYAECRLGHWREAEVHFWKAVELDPRNFRLWTLTARQIFPPLHRYEEARKALDRAEEISPNNETVITDRANLFQEEGRFDEARKELARIPNDTLSQYPHIIRTVLAMDERRFDDAIHWSKEATKTLKTDDPLSAQDIFIMNLRGYCQEWAGRPEEARATFERIVHEIGSTPTSVIAPGRGIRSQLALAYAGLGDKQNALQQAHQAVADFDGDALVQPTIKRDLAQIEARFGDIDSAMDLIAQLLETPRGMEIGDLQYSPIWDPLRKDPRFQPLLNNPPPIRY
jgi:serine/threonine protein kinase/tetratricopeptide (TPR) repeat protein